MLYEWNQLLATAIRSYRLGMMLPDRMSDGMRGELFARRGQALIRQRLSAAEAERYAALRQSCQAAVQLIHGRQLDASRAAFEELAATLDQFESDEGRWLGHSWIQQGKAFLEARCQAWDAARQCLREAMESDTRLEEEHDYALFHIARVHVVHLWLRVEAQAGNRALALQTCQAIFDYLAEKRSDLPLGRGWSRQRAQEIDPDLRNAMRARIASEVGAQLASVERDEALTLWGSFSAWRQMENHDALSEIYLWGVAKDAYLRGDTTGFLNACSPLLAAGRGETTLFYTTALDLCRCCHALRPTPTRPFLLEVAEQSQAMGRSAGGRFGPPSQQAFKRPGALSRKPDNAHQIGRHGLLPRAAATSFSLLQRGSTEDRNLVALHPVRQLSLRQRAYGSGDYPQDHRPSPRGLRR